MSYPIEQFPLQQLQRFVEVVTPPQYEPMALDEAKRWLRIDPSDSNHDQVVDLLIAALRRDLENRTHRAFIPRTLKVNWNGWPVDGRYGLKLVLPFPPLIELLSVEYVDIYGNTLTLDPSKYQTHSDMEPAVILPVWGAVFPTVRRQPNAVQVTFRAGYAPGSPDNEATEQAAVPENARIWMGMKIATLFENRQHLGTAAELPHDYTDGLLDELVVASRLF